MQQTAPVGPEIIFQTLSAYQQSYALKAGIEIELFTRMAEGNKTGETIARACNASERGIRILCDALTVLGFLTKENNEYQLTEVSAQFLVKGPPSYLGGTADFIISDKLLQGFAGLPNAVRQGGSTIAEGSLDPESPMWVKFARGMMGMMFPVSQIIAEKLDFPPDQKLKVLDIAAGHGIFGIAVAQKYPNAEIHALDWANVLEVATENAEKFGVADRHHLIEGNAFEEDFGEDYDVVLLTNFLHHFDKGTCEKLLAKIHESLGDNGKVITLEFIPNDDRVSPPVEAMFSLTMLAGTPAGDAYTFKEIKEMFDNSGFSASEHIPLAPLPQHLVISTK